MLETATVESGKEVTLEIMFIVRFFQSLTDKAIGVFRKKKAEEWLTPQLYTGKSMCELGTCDCDSNPECICCK